MYLIYIPNQHKAYFYKELELDSPLFNWVHDYNVGVFWCENEYLKVELSMFNT